VDLPFDTRTRVFVIIVVNIIGFYLFVLLLQYYLLLTRSLIGRTASRTMNQFLIFLMVIAAVAYGFSTAVYANSANIKPFLWVHKSFVTVPIIISGIATLVLFMNAGHIKLKSQVKTVRIFSLIYLVFFCYQLCLWILPVHVWIMLSAFNLLIFNIIPIPFLSNLLQKHKTAVLDQTETRSNIENFFKVHGLSKREKEIVQLVVSGLSNKEIENELYISKFTVKKHISNIFMKVDVNSRPQLINRILQAALSDSYDSPQLF
jgi:DNA-binding CsgD family transcriptional regulator